MGIAFNPGEVNANEDKEVILKTPTGTNLFGVATSANSLPVVLASDQAIIPTQNLKEQFLRTGKLFHASIGVSPGTSYGNKILLRNPSGSGINMILFDVVLTLNLAATTNQLNQLSMRFRKEPTVTSPGTAQTTRNVKLGASDTTQGEVFTDPVTSAPGTFIADFNNINQPTKMLIPFILEPGQDINIQMKINDANNGTQFFVVFAEDLT